MTNYDKYVDLFKKNFNVSDEKKIEELTYNGVEEWDSINHLLLMAELESEFSINLKSDDKIEFTSFYKGLTILRQYGIDI